ncbi:MAG: hypothetical protein WCP16_02290 [Pseudanabaena sp. ELA645]|jgi:hypothetical protein
MVALRAFLVSLSLPTLVIFSASFPSNNISIMGNTVANSDSVNTTVLAIVPQKNIVFDTQTTEEPGGKGRIDPGGLGRIS